MLYCPTRRPRNKISVEWEDVESGMSRSTVFNYLFTSTFVSHLSPRDLSPCAHQFSTSPAAGKCPHQEEK